VRKIFRLVVDKSTIRQINTCAISGKSLATSDVVKVSKSADEKQSQS